MGNPNSPAAEVVLRFSSWLDWSPYSEDECGAVPLWYTFHAVGPAAGRSVFGSDEVNDWIAFCTDDEFTEEEFAALLSRLTEGETLTLPFRLDTSHSETRDGDEWEDYCDGCTIELRSDANRRLTAAVTFNDPTE